MKILGIEYKQRYMLAANNSNVVAMCDNMKCEIVYPLGKPNPPDMVKSATIHEIIEALNYMMELKLDHQVITCLEAGLNQVFVAAGVDLSPLVANIEPDTDNA